MPVADLIIRLRDQASGGLGKIGGAIAGLGGGAAKAAAGTQNFTESIRNGVLQANAVTFALGKAQQAVGFLNSKFEEAKNLQLEQITAATTFSSLTGQSAEEAGRFIENLNSRLAKSAASLPGATQDYKNLATTIQDNVLEAFKDPSGKLNQKGFEDSLTSISESFGALTAASTKMTGNTALGLTKALSGASTAELRSIAFFEQNPVILNEIDKQLNAQGKTLKDLNIKERVALIQQVGKKFITEDFKKQAGESVDGLIQSFNSTLFDPSEGLFGIMKDLDPSVDGVQSAFKSLNEGLIEVIGPEGIVFQFAELLQLAGVSFPQPMAVLKGAIDFGVAGLKKVNEGLSYLKAFFKAGGDLTGGLRLAAGLIAPSGGSFLNNLPQTIFNLGAQFGGLLDRVVKQAGPLFNQGVGAISKFFSDPGKLASIGQELGVAAGSAIGRIGGALIGFLGQVDYPQLLVGIGRAAIAIGAGLLSFLASLVGGMALAQASGTGSLLSNLGAATMGAFNTFTLAIAQTLVDGMGLVGSLVKSTLGRIPLIGAVISGLLDFQLGGAQALVSSGLGGLFTYITTALSTGWAAITASAGQVVAAGLTQAASAILGPLGNIPLVGSTIGAFVSVQLGAFEALITGGIGGLFTYIVEAGKALVASLQQKINGFIEQARSIPGVGGFIPAPLPPTQAATVGRPIAVGVTSRYRGAVGTAAGGFLGNLVAAAQKELANMPSGAGLVMANSSETIIPQGLLGAALGAILPTLTAAAPAPVGTALGAILPAISAAAPAPVGALAPALTTPAGAAAPNITVNINGANADPQQIASEVIARIQGLFDAAGSAQL